MKTSEPKSSKPSGPARKPGVWTALRRLVVAGAAIYLGATVVVFLLQRKLIYHPPVFTSEAVEQMAATEHLERWRNSSGEAIGWKRLSPVQPARGTILITHGNAGCAFQCGHYADAIQQAMPFDVFAVEYPGYADHPGKPSEQSLYEAATKGLASLSTDKPLYIVGESLGTGVAAYLAGKFSNQVTGVVLLAPYKRLADVAQSHMPMFPVRLMLLDRFPAANHLLNYHGPIAMLVAGRDQVIPGTFGHGLFDSYSGAKKLWTYSEGDHGTVMTQPAEVWREIMQFWESYQSSPKVPSP